MSASPRLSVGLPVYNGQNFLTESLDALLRQSFTDFELVISDNASSDSTEEICRDYARQDGRIRFIRQPVNVGAAPNHDVVLREARGTYFKWASHDDLYGPDLLARCVQVLDERPEIVLCHSDMAYVDASSEIIAKYDYMLRTDSPSAPERFRSLLYTEGGDDEYGVMRTEVVKRVNPQGSYHNAGRPLVAEIALNGPFHQVPELLYYRREHPGRGDRNPTIRAVCKNLDPRRVDHSTARLMGEYIYGYIDAIRRAPLSAADRRACYRHLAQWLAVRGIGGAAHRTAGALRNDGPSGPSLPKPSVTTTEDSRR